MIIREGIIIIVNGIFGILTSLEKAIRLEIFEYFLCHCHLILKEACI